MNLRASMRVGVATAVGIVSGVLMLGVVRSLAPSLLGGAAGAVIALATGGVVAVALVLSGRAMASVEPPAMPELATCGCCGREVRVDWRLCPHCGSMMPQDCTTST